MVTMRCPHCGQADSRVVDTRDTATGIRRRRECLTCRGRFTTYEQLASQSIQIVKRDGRREDYDREKLLAGVRKACTKRPIPSEAIENVVNQVEAELAESGRLEIPSERLGQMVMERLRDLDEVAYVRFASVYLPIADLNSLRQVMDRLLE
jgi:transcriptional repressor NrdR